MKTKQPTKNRRKIDHTFAQQWQICKSNEAKEENLQREVLENNRVTKQERERNGAWVNTTWRGLQDHVMGQFILQSGTEKSESV